MMIKQSFNALKRSIFFKLFLIFIATALLLFGLSALAINYWLDPDRLSHKAVQDNLFHYSSYLIEEIGNPVDKSIAEKLSQDLGLEIRIETDSQVWHSNNFNAPEKFFYVHDEISQHPGMKIGHGHGYSFVSLVKNDNQFLFALNHQRLSHNKDLALLVFIGILSIVIGFSYYLVKWQFRPVKWLSQGVSQVAKGDYSVKVPVRKHDELGELAEAFNNMSAKIQHTMHSKEQLLLDVSHELRSPIARMKLAVEMLENDNLKASLGSDIKEMEMMITELLESARLNTPDQSLKKQRTNLCELVSNLLVHYHEQMPGVVLNCPVTPLELMLDAERIKVVFRNMVENALKYSQQQSKPVEIEIQEHSAGVIVSVTDYGQGIPLQDMPHIFEPFYRVDKSRNTSTGGYGLGLSLCLKIMAAHGGDIKVESVVGEGSIFKLYFPSS